MSDRATDATINLSHVAAEVAAWVEQHWQPQLTLAEWWSALCDAGFAFPHWPAGCGGRGQSRAATQTVLGELARAGVIGPPAGNAPNMGVPTVLAHGTNEQHARFVRPVANGRETWCQLFSEPGAGSDLAALSCKAERDGDEFVITGQKVWNSSADVAEWGMLLARTNPDAPKHAGITWMMIDMRQPGVDTRPLVQMNGDAKFCEVFLTEARVPVANVIGGIDNGWAVARTTLSFERSSAGAHHSGRLPEVRAGGLGGNLDVTVGELLERAQHASQSPKQRFDVMLGVKSMIRLARDQGLSADPVVRDRVADFYIRSEVHRLNGARARDAVKIGRVGSEGSIGKLSLALLAHRSRDLSMALLGANSMLVGDDASDGGRVARTGLTSFVPSLGGGTNEIQRNVIGERTLGLPREPSNDGEVAFRDLKRS